MLNIGFSPVPPLPELEGFLVTQRKNKGRRGDPDPCMIETADIGSEAMGAHLYIGMDIMVKELNNERMAGPNFWKSEQSSDPALIKILQFL